MPRLAKVNKPLVTTTDLWPQRYIQRKQAILENPNLSTEAKRSQIRKLLLEIATKRTEARKDYDEIVRIRGLIVDDDANAAEYKKHLELAQKTLKLFDDHLDFQKVMAEVNRLALPAPELPKSPLASPRIEGEETRVRKTRKRRKPKTKAESKPE